MSDAPVQSSPPPGPANQVLTFLGGIGAILVFLLILLVAYLPNRPEPVDTAVVEQRLATRSETEAAGVAKIEGYAVVNAEAGVVQIPVEQAMERTLREYAAGGETVPAAGE